MSRSIQRRAYEFALGLGWLIVGALVYRVARGPALGQIPSLSHAAAFSLMTAAAFGPGRRAAASACLAWAVGDSLLEFGQSAGLGHVLAGRFDVYDVLAGLAGAAIAFAFLREFRGSEAVAARAAS